MMRERIVGIGAKGADILFIADVPNFTVFPVQMSVQRIHLGMMYIIGSESAKVGVLQYLCTPISYNSVLIDTPNSTRIILL